MPGQGWRSVSENRTICELVKHSPAFRDVGGDEFVAFRLDSRPEKVHDEIRRFPWNLL